MTSTYAITNGLSNIFSRSVDTPPEPRYLPAMRAPRNYPVEQPAFGLYPVPEGWAVWAHFPVDSAREVFLAWAGQNGIAFDIERHPPEALDHQYGAVVDQAKAEVYRSRWVTV